MADKAILFGVNNYKTISNLRGCENDLSDIRRLLTEFYGFAESNIKTHANEKVAKAAIEEGFDWLAEGSNPGDRLVFHFSGHGSYTTSASKDKDVDELICLYDMDWNDQETFIRDSDLGRLTRKVDTGARLTVILDSCHFGSGTRGITANMRAATRTTSRTELIIVQDTAKQLARQRGVSADHEEGIVKASAGTMRLLKQLETPPVYARFVEPPTAIQQAIQKRRAFRVRAIGESVRIELNHQLLAASHEKQTAADAFIDGGYHGAFSYYLCDTARTDSSASFDSIMKRTAQRIKTEGYGQDPQIEGPFGAEKLFGGSESSVVPEGDRLPRADEPKDSDEFAPYVASPNTPCCDLNSAGAGADSGASNSGALDTLSQLLRVSEKLIDLARPTTAGATAATVKRERALADEVIVYVHGISEHLPGYSRAWHNAIARHLAHPIRRAEVRWSQHVNARAVAESATRKIEMESFQNRVQAELERRMNRLDEMATQRSVASGSPRSDFHADGATAQFPFRRLRQIHARGSDPRTGAQRIHSYRCSRTTGGSQGSHCQP